ncbi:hypothetical protein K0038_02967 [Pseudomonas syringae]|nr:hypothetical protein [Pseudomonas syringae]
MGHFMHIKTRDAAGSFKGYLPLPSGGKKSCPGDRPRAGR